MKKAPILSAVSLCLLLILGLSSVSTAQLRKNESNPTDLMGPIVKSKQVDRSKGANLGNLFNMTMDQSYSMMFSSFGGQLQNLNMYTNTMHFFFSPKLTGRVDLSILHSPFGNSFMSNGNHKGMDAKFLIRNAELDYQISDKSSISIQFQQLPAYGYGMGGPWSGGFYRGPFSSPFQDRNF